MNSDYRKNGMLRVIYGDHRKKLQLKPVVMFGLIAVVPIVV